MKTAILTVGTEILFGQIVNTNAAYISEQLQNLGMDVLYHYSVGDNPKRLKKMLDVAYEDCDMVITTGGLGPTQDDITKEIITEYFGEELVEFPEETEKIKNHFEKAKYKWSDNNLKQAFFPLNAIVLTNSAGTAPGFLLEKNGKVVVALPGPPNEMKSIFNAHVVPYLEKKRDGVIYYRIIRTRNLGESTLETMLLPLIDGQTDPTIATYAKEGECSLRITSKRSTYAEAERACLEMIEKVKGIIGDYIYSENNENLIDIVGRLLIEKNISISCCESCTGGLFAKMFTDVPGISKVFDRGIVTYSYRAKEEELYVKPETLKKYTAESEEVAVEMAEGLKKKTGSDICISITGVAGPDDLSPDKPAGLAYIGISYMGKTECVEVKRRSKGREYNRIYFALRMVNEVYRLIK